jgi:hypothetical protein
MGFCFDEQSDRARSCDRRIRGSEVGIRASPRFSKNCSNVGLWMESDANLIVVPDRQEDGDASFVPGRGRRKVELGAEDDTQIFLLAEECSWSFAVTQCVDVAGQAEAVVHEFVESFISKGK